MVVYLQKTFQFMQVGEVVRSLKNDILRDPHNGEFWASLGVVMIYTIIMKYTYERNILGSTNP
jgi:hypothetical protein